MMWHVLCGDVAARQLSPLIKRDDSTQIKVLRDDLAVGPLQDVDRPPCAARVAFWQSVWPEEARAELDLSLLSSDAQWLQALPQQPYSVTVWHGDSASEQLMLARVAFWLGESPVSFHEVHCGTGQKPYRRTSGRQHVFPGTTGRVRAEGSLHGPPPPAGRYLGGAAGIVVGVALLACRAMPGQWLRGARRRAHCGL